MKCTGSGKLTLSLTENDRPADGGIVRIERLWLHGRRLLAYRLAGSQNRVRRESRSDEQRQRPADVDEKPNRSRQMQHLHLHLLGPPDEVPGPGWGQSGGLHLGSADGKGRG